MTHKGKLAVIAALPGTTSSIMGKTGIKESSVRRWLNICQAEGALHIGEWLRSGGNFQAQYVAGPGVNADCKLRTRTNAQHSKQFRKRARLDGRYQDILAQERGKWWADSAVRKAAKRPNNWASSLGLPTIAGAA